MFQNIKNYILKKSSDQALEAEFLRRQNEDLLADDVPQEVADLILKDLSEIDKIDLLLKSMLKKDRAHYFNATPETQQLVKGAFMRTIWLLKQIRSQRKDT